MFGSYDLKLLEKRMLERTQKTETCWNWVGGLGPSGYGNFWIGQKNFRVHRASYALYKGPIQEGMYIDHTCRNRKCLNPEHLRQVTPYQNVHENSLSPAIANKAKTHCPKGHEYTPENTQIKTRKNHKMRACRECMRIYARANRKPYVAKERSGITRPRQKRRELLECKKGHPFDLENTYVLIRPDGKKARACKICKRVRNNLCRKNKREIL